MKANLPNFLAFKPAIDLIRLGKNNDGGYLASKADVKSTDLLIGLGINTDWSFEEDFKKVIDTKLIAFDGSVSVFTFFMIFLKLCLTLRFRKAKEVLIILIKFIIFFSKKKNSFHNTFVGNDNLLESNKHMPLSEIFEDNLQENIFLKIDVEGSEYRFLDTLIKYQRNICGMVIEMHDCDLNLKLIESFISKLNLNLVHIHANNYASINSNGIPAVLEFTFSRNCKFSETQKLPHPLDMPNCVTKPEIELVINE